MVPTQLLADRINRLSNILEKGLYERHDAIRLCLLATLCGESVFLMGPPGIAKSLIARRLKHAFVNATAFEYLMTRFSTPEEVFGPLSIQALKDEGRYERITHGYLPDAEIVFLDEIWKAGPAILNTLLTAINEKRFRNGEQEYAIPMRVLIAASNEFPEKESGLEALYDRMLIRIWLDNVHEKKSFHGMLVESSEQVFSDSEKNIRITDEEYLSWQKSITKVSLPDEVFELIYQLKQQLATLPDAPYISDRRWKKAIHLLQASAFFSGREAIAPIDLIVLKECLWHDRESKTRVEQQIRVLMTQYGWQQQAILLKLQQFKAAKIASLQQQNLDMALLLVKQNSLFSRKPHYTLPDNITERELFLSLQQTLIIRDIKVTHLVINRDELTHWLQKEGEIKAKLNGIGFAQAVDLSIDEQGYLLIRNISLQASRLNHEAATQALTHSGYPISLESDLSILKDQLQKQMLLFRQNQQCLFVDNEWLAMIEDSLQQVAELINQEKL